MRKNPMTDGVKHAQKETPKQPTNIAVSSEMIPGISGISGIGISADLLIQPKPEKIEAEEAPVIFVPCEAIKLNEPIDVDQLTEEMIPPTDQPRFLFVSELLFILFSQE